MLRRVRHGHRRGVELRRGTGPNQRKESILVRAFLYSCLCCLPLCAFATGAFASLKSARPPAVAGSFYPADAGELRAAVRAYLDAAVPVRQEEPLALIVPHAGYIYSGQIAADAWKQVAGHNYDLIVIVGINHKAAGFDGISVYDGPGYQTPLGVARCDRQLAAALNKADPRFAYSERADAQEHSVEVQVPFAQVVLPDVPIVAVVVGSADGKLWRAFGRALAKELSGRHPLLVASSDLSHYPPHDVAQASDHAVVSAIASLDPNAVQKTIRHTMQEGLPGLVTCACGEGDIVAVMTAAKLLGATRASVLSLANSGDTALGDVDRCVGYAAVTLTAGDRPSDTAALSRPIPLPPPGERLSDEDRSTLLTFARRTIAQYLASKTTPLFRENSPELLSKQGAFVTLRKHGALRGCIGHMAEDRALGQVVGAMALQAAFNDRRFPPLSKSELAEIEIEISVLSPAREVTDPRDIVLGRDGVVLKKLGHSAVFLPQVATEQGWNRSELLSALSRKAELPSDAWQKGAVLSVFRAEVFSESEQAGP